LKLLYLVPLSIVFTALIFFTGCGDNTAQTIAPVETEQLSEQGQEEVPPTERPASKPERPASKPDHLASRADSSKDLESMVILVNKHNSLPSDYVPEDLVEVDISFPFEGASDRKLMREDAAVHLEELFKQAAREGLKLYGTSGYRSYQTQEVIFARNVKKYGSKSAANRVSAYAGQSEHQTGLAMDVTSPKVDFRLVQCFGDLPEGKWLVENAADYGFIIRYPRDKENITGYTYEPWHLRYVGVRAAGEIAQKGKTLEQYHESDVWG